MTRFEQIRKRFFIQCIVLLGRDLLFEALQPELAPLELWELAESIGEVVTRRRDWPNISEVLDVGFGKVANAPRESMDWVTRVRKQKRFFVEDYSSFVVNPVDDLAVSIAIS